MRPVSVKVLHELVGGRCRTTQVISHGEMEVTMRWLKNEEESAVKLTSSTHLEVGRLQRVRASLGVVRRCRMMRSLRRDRYRKVVQKRYPE
jgi:hypothetical protein